ncbi:MAG: hypothetical protein KDD67_10975 [Ignavibacteriae bacterium]|nr:hypothetical protein [Ignavibacteriota bacterium]MCB9215812.1 hypothetical protein [Ignavibacteria bacterium]
MIRFFLLYISLSLVGGITLYCQGISSTVDLILLPSDSLIQLPHEFLIEKSFLLRDSSGTELHDSIDYTLNLRFGTIRLSDSLRGGQDTLRFVATYSYFPITVPREIYTRELLTITDSTGKERTLAERSNSGSSLTATNIFGKDFQRSGSITRGITVGSNRDLTVQSGLRLQFSGKITDDVEVIGALTDEQTPIQPDGNTQTLREIDNIFFEVRSPVADGTLGKFFASNNQSEFTGFSRKLQGGKVVGKFSSLGSTQLVAAVSPGKFRTQEFQGREGDQGPYRLTGANGERDIIVLAGTEQVFVDGVEMIRGRENDYVIDYGTGEIFFQPRRPITGFNEIVVDFEFSDRRYSRSFLAASHTGRFVDSMLSLTVGYVREADNQDAPVDLELSEEDRLLLASAGADPAGAIRTGVAFVGRSDTVSGLYRRVDTTINGQPDSVFIYDPSSSEALYDVIFSRAISGRGDYRNVAFGQYEFVGKGAGEYLPVVYLPLPGLLQVGAVALGLRPSKGVDVEAEVAFSGTNLNRFSSDPLASRKGIAVKGGTTLEGDSIRIGGVNIGRVRGTSSLRFIGEGFQGVNRIAEPEFDRRWNASGRIGESGFNDVIVEGRFDWKPIQLLELTAGLGNLDRGDFFSSLRHDYAARFGDRTFPLAADYGLEFITSNDTTGGGVASDWLKGRGGVSYRLGAITPGFRVEHQNRNDLRSGVDTLLPSAFRFVEAGPDLTLNFSLFRTTASLRYRVDDSVRFDLLSSSTRFLRDGEAQTFRLNGELTGIRSLNTTLDFTYRRKTYDTLPGLDPSTRLENVSIIARSESRWTGLKRGVEVDGVYEVQTERAARLQRLFVRVPVGQGQFVWQDIDSNGVQSENEFRETIADDGEYVRINLPTEQLFPVIDLEASLRLKVKPENFLSDSSTLGKLLKPITTETFLRIEEKSSTENESEVYLLNFGAFQNDSTTLLGNALIQQDINLFEKSREFSARLRFVKRDGITKLFNDLERSGSVERSLRLQWNPTVDIGLQLDASLEDRSLLGAALDASRGFDLEALEFETDFSYRPERSLELGWTFTIRSADDIFPTTPRSTFLTGNEIRGIYSIETKGRLRATVERTVVSGTNLQGGDVFSLPFQLTDGYGIGTTWIGRIGFDYRFGANIQASINYTGRAEPPTNRVIHTGQMEVRAFF